MSFTYTLLAKMESRSLRKIYKFPKSQRTQRTMSAVFSDALRGILPTTDKMCVTRNFQSM